MDATPAFSVASAVVMKPRCFFAAPRKRSSSVVTPFFPPPGRTSVSIVTADGNRRQHAFISLFSARVSLMEFDPETNTYTSHGPAARASDLEAQVKILRRAVARLEARVEALERG